MLNTLGFILTISLLGFSIVSCFNIKLRILTTMSLIFPVGAAILTIYCWLLSLLKVEYSFVAIYIPIICASIVILFINFYFLKRKITSFFQREMKSYHSWKMLIIPITGYVIMFIQYVYILTHSMSLAIYQPDELSHWAFQAKVIYEGASLDSFYGGEGFETGFEVYPSFMPLLVASYYIFCGEIIDSFVRVIGPLFLGSVMLFLLSKINELIRNRSIAMLLVGIFVSSGFVVFEMTTGLYADITYTFFYTISVICLLSYLNTNRKIKYLVYSALFMALASWTKTDGQYITIIHSFILILFGLKNMKIRELIKHCFIYLSISLSISILWKIYTNLREYPASRWIIDPHPEYFFQMLTSSINQMFNTYSWGLLWIIILSFFVVNIFVGMNKEQLLLILIIVLNILFLYFSYITMFGAEALTAASFSRYILRLAPIGIIYVALVIRSSIEHKVDEGVHK